MQVDIEILLKTLLAFPTFNMCLYLGHGTKNVREAHILMSHYFYPMENHSGRHQ